MADQEKSSFHEAFQSGHCFGGEKNPLSSHEAVSALNRMSQDSPRNEKEKGFSAQSCCSTFIKTYSIL